MNSVHTQTHKTHTKLHIHTELYIQFNTHATCIIHTVYIHNGRECVCVYSEVMACKEAGCYFSDCGVSQTECTGGEQEGEWVGESVLDRVAE